MYFENLLKFIIIVNGYYFLYYWNFRYGMVIMDIKDKLYMDIELNYFISIIEYYIVIN